MHCPFSGSAYLSSHMLSYHCSVRRPLCHPARTHDQAATASPKNHELAKSHGADAVADYCAKSVVAQIIMITAVNRGGVDTSSAQSRRATACGLGHDTCGPRCYAVVLLINKELLDETVEYYNVLCPSIFPLNARFGPLLVPVTRRLWQRDERIMAWGWSLSQTLTS
jgi:hypothetical protein